MAEIPVYFLGEDANVHDIHYALAQFIGLPGILVLGPVDRIVGQKTCFIYFNLRFLQSLKKNRWWIDTQALFAAAKVSAGKYHIDTSVDFEFVDSDVKTDTVAAYIVRLDFPKDIAEDVDLVRVSENVGNLILRDAMPKDK